MVQAKLGASTTAEQTVEGMLAEAQDETVAFNQKPRLKLVEKAPSEPDADRVPWPFDERKDDSDWLLRPNVRREDSVIAEIVRARSEKLWKVGAVARRMSTQIKRSVDVLHDSSRNALRRFESLPRSKQIMWVATPYVGAAFLVGLLMAFDDGDDITPVPIPAAMAQTPVVTKAEPPPPEPPPAPPPAPNVSDAEVHQLPVAATLYARPEGEMKIARVRPQTLRVYPSFPAAEGWVLVVTEKGTVGYLEKARLEGEPEAKKSKKKRVRPRRRK